MCQYINFISLTILWKIRDTNKYYKTKSKTIFKTFGETMKYKEYRHKIYTYIQSEKRAANSN